MYDIYVHQMRKPNYKPKSTINTQQEIRKARCEGLYRM